MPFYEYQCSACGHHHEELQKVTDRPLRKCPACGRATLKRLVSAPVFRLKGGGWYETDFKNDKESKRNLAGEKEPATGDASAEKPADKPAEAKPDSKPAEKKPEAAPKAAPARKPKPARPRVARRRPARR
ncbi:MAG TPA: zinc ribbon domain-containing protein [Steroidobacteraceae bacterium]|nr:zinc ribbon domain-containing protein [Steroidobacteraceae bacterium]